MYYILQNNETKGPYTIGQVRSMWNSGVLTADASYSVDGQNNWQPLRLFANQLECSGSVTPSSPIVSATTIGKSQGCYLCLDCLSVSDGKSYTPGYFLVELALWLFFLAPGLIYSIWRCSGRKLVCSMCNSSRIVPTTSPVAIAQRSTMTPTVAAPHAIVRPVRGLQSEQKTAIRALGRGLRKLFVLVERMIVWTGRTAPKTIWSNYNATLRRVTGEDNEILLGFLRWVGVCLFTVTVFVIGPKCIRIAMRSKAATASASATTSSALSIAEPSVPPRLANSTPQKQIAYRVVGERPIPNGGYAREIVIDPSNRNETDLRLLGESLKRDTRKDRNAIVRIFDNMKAAAMTDGMNAKAMSGHASDLEGDDWDFYEKHMIGCYSRITSSGFHGLSIRLNGSGSGATAEVAY